MVQYTSNHLEREERLEIMLYLDYKTKKITTNGKKIGYQLVPKLRPTKSSAAVFGRLCGD